MTHYKRTGSKTACGKNNKHRKVTRVHRLVTCKACIKAETPTGPAAPMLRKQFGF